MDLIHSIEVARLLADNKVTSLDSWLWQKQLRFYMNDKGKIVVLMTDATFNYRFTRP